MASITTGNNKTEVAEARNSLSLPVQRRVRDVKEHHSRSSSASSTDVQLLTKVRGISLIQASECVLKLSSAIGL